MSHLKVRFHDGATAEVDLEGEMVIGRQPDCALVLSEKVVSRKHASLAPEKGEWVLSDLKSSMGTFVNGARIQRHTLRPGDEVRIGGNVMTYDPAYATKA